MNFNEIIQCFQAEMSKYGINPPADIVADSHLHRFYINGDKPGSRNGWYVLFIDGLPSGVFGNWKIGITSSWCAKKTNHMNEQEFLKHKQQVNEAQHKRNAERAMDQEKAAKLAEERWYSCPAANTNHPYLVRKLIPPFYARQLGNELILPIINVESEFRSLQYISEDGTKRFLFNGEIKGNFIPVRGQPKISTEIMIAEGFSTAGAIAQVYPEACLIAACDAGNLRAVALSIRQHLPKAKMIICADTDEIGLIKAHEAATASGSRLIKPKWPKGTPASFNDFNDLLCWYAGKEIAA